MTSFLSEATITFFEMGKAWLYERPKTKQVRPLGQKNLIQLRPTTKLEKNQQLSNF